jgi:formate hydrogenlyase subunit 3/multisubunit Na+/H+ antiporter MnhD subunit
VSVVLLVLTCIVTGVAVRLLRRLPRLVFIASLIGAGWLGGLVAVASGEPGSFLGRTFALDPGARAFLWIVVGAASALALFAPLTFERVGDAPSSAVANSQGAFFFWSLAPFVVAVVIDSFPLAVFAWAMGLIVLMLSAQPQSEGRVGGAAQFLLLIVIASASLLLANRFFDLYPLTPENLDLIRNAVIFLALGFGLLLSVAPLHIWLGPLTDELSPLGVAFLVGVAQSIGVWLLLQQMSDVTWLVTKSQLLNVLLFGGLLTAPLGALLALAERRDARLVTYLSLLPLGHALVGLGLGTRLAWAGAWLAVVNRGWGVALVAGGMSFTRHHPERRWQIIGASAMLLGGLALAGVPPMLDFAANYSIYHDLGGVNQVALAVLIASNAFGVLAILRVVWRIVAERAQAEETNEEFKIIPYFCTVVVIVLLAVMVGAGIFPQLVSAPLLETLGKASYLK